MTATPRRSRPFFVVLLAAAGAMLVSLCLVTCGGTTARDDPARATGEAAANPLAGRYDEVFPDDRVQTVRILMPAKDWESLKQTAMDKKYYRADVWIDDELIRNVAVRAKGHSSLRRLTTYGSHRFGLKVDINYYDKELHYHGIKKLNYNCGYRDPTLMKDLIGYELMAAIGVPSPRACFVDLWVNDTHLGVYTQVEQIDSHFLDRHFVQSAGNLYKPKLMAGKLDWTQKDVTGVNEGYIKSVSLKNNKRLRDYSRLFDLLEVLNSDPAEVSPRELERVLDVDEILRFFAVSVVCGHFDSYIGAGHNYYLYEEGRRFCLIPWDMNLAFGATLYDFSREEILDFSIDQPSPTVLSDYPLAHQLLSEPEYLNRYHSYIRQLIEGPFSPPTMIARIQEIAAVIRPYVLKDDNRLYPMEAFERGLTDDVPLESLQGLPPSREVIGLASFVEARVTSIKEQSAGNPGFAP